MIAIILKLSWTTELNHITRSVDVEFVAILQVIFIYLPTISFLLFGIKKFFVKVMSNLKCKKKVYEEKETAKFNIVSTNISHTSIELAEPFL